MDFTTSRETSCLFCFRVEGEWSLQRVAGSRGGDKLALRFTLYYQLK